MGNEFRGNRSVNYRCLTPCQTVWLPKEAWQVHHLEEEQTDSVTDLEKEVRLWGVLGSATRLVPSKTETVFLEIINEKADRQIKKKKQQLPDRWQQKYTHWRKTTNKIITLVQSDQSCWGGETFWFYSLQYSAAVSNCSIQQQSTSWLRLECFACVCVCVCCSLALFSAVEHV